MSSLVCGVGVNDSNYVVYKWEELGNVGGKRKKRLIWRCVFYQTWVNMIYRCYSGKESTYAGCEVCPEWLVFSSFKVWMEKQDYLGKHLDKDLLLKGNRVYCPEFCVFIAIQINSFLVDRKSKRGEFPIGVCFFKALGKYKSNCSKGNGKPQHLGYYETAEEAHEAWRKYKHLLACKLADSQSDDRVSKALRNFYKQ